MRSSTGQLASLRYYTPEPDGEGVIPHDGRPNSSPASPLGEIEVGDHEQAIVTLHCSTEEPATGDRNRRRQNAAPESPAKLTRPPDTERHGRVGIGVQTATSFAGPTGRCRSSSCGTQRHWRMAPPFVGRSTRTPRRSPRLHVRCRRWRTPRRSPPSPTPSCATSWATHVTVVRSRPVSGDDHVGGRQLSVRDRLSSGVLCARSER